jgi:hypothetical protein
VESLFIAPTAACGDAAESPSKGVTTLRQVFYIRGPGIEDARWGNIIANRRRKTGPAQNPCWASIVSASHFPPQTGSRGEGGEGLGCFELPLYVLFSHILQKTIIMVIKEETLTTLT